MSHSRPIYIVFTPRARPRTTSIARPIARRCRSAEERDPLEDLAPVRCRSSVICSGGEKSRLGTLEGVRGGVGGVGGSEGGVGGRAGGGPFVAKDLNGTAVARRATDLVNTANIPLVVVVHDDQKFY